MHSRSTNPEFSTVSHKGSKWANVHFHHMIFVFCSPKTLSKHKSSESSKSRHCTYIHNGAKPHFYPEIPLILIFQKCEFYEKWDFRNMNFEKIEIFIMWILWKMRFQKGEFCKNWDFQCVNFWIKCRFLPHVQKYVSIIKYLVIHGVAG